MVMMFSYIYIHFFTLCVILSEDRLLKSENVGDSVMR
jgi:hypothetical protein